MVTVTPPQGPGHLQHSQHLFKQELPTSSPSLPPSPRAPIGKASDGMFLLFPYPPPGGDGVRQWLGREELPGELGSDFPVSSINLSIGLSQGFAAACRTFPLGHSHQQRVGSSSLTRKGAQSPYLGSEESQPLDTTQGGPEPSSKGSRNPQSSAHRGLGPRPQPTALSPVGWGQLSVSKPVLSLGLCYGLCLRAPTHSVIPLLFMLLLRKASNGWKSSEAGLTEERRGSVVSDFL